MFFAFFFPSSINVHIFPNFFLLSSKISVCVYIYAYVNFIVFYYYMCVYVCMHACIMVSMWETGLFFYHIGTRDQTQVEFGSNPLYPLSHLVDHVTVFLLLYDDLIFVPLYISFTLSGNLSSTV